MPLSEREQELLEQMERALYAEDPRFVSQLRAGADGIARRRRYLVAGLAGAVGLAAVVGAVMVKSIPLGVVGFLVMVAGGAYAFAPSKPPLGTVQADGSVRPAQRPGGRTGSAAGRQQGGLSLRMPGTTREQGCRATGSGSFMERLEQRWERRRERGEW